MLQYAWYTFTQNLDLKADLDVSMPEANLDTPSFNVNADAPSVDMDLQKPSADLDFHMPDINIPKFGFKGKEPKTDIKQMKCY